MSTPRSGVPYAPTVVARQKADDADAFVHCGEAVMNLAAIHQLTGAQQETVRLKLEAKNEAFEEAM